MLVKEYYRISELKDRFDVSVEDIKYLVENSKIELVFYIESHQYIYGGWLKDKGFVGYGSLNYCGLVKISEQEQHDLVLKDNIKLRCFRLIDRKNISNVNHDYPYETSPPHAFIYAWQPKSIKSIEWDYIPAKLFHNEQEHHLRTVGNMFKDAVAIFDVAPKSPPKENLMDRIPKKGFYHDGIKLQFSDSCVLHKDLVALNIIKPELTVNTNQPPSKSERLIDILLTRLLDQFPDDKPAKVWEKLKADLNNEPRLFDIDEIIDEIDLDTLYWFDDKADVNKMKKKSFYNLIKKLKIN